VLTEQVKEYHGRQSVIEIIVMSEVREKEGGYQQPMQQLFGIVT
jgi:hypothetical protein